MKYSKRADIKFQTNFLFVLSDKAIFLTMGRTTENSKDEILTNLIVFIQLIHAITHFQVKVMNKNLHG